MDASASPKPRASSEYQGLPPPQQVHTLYREEQRVSLRAFLRGFLQNEQIAHSQAMAEFLTGNVVRLNEEELDDVQRRLEMDEKRVEEQRRFYEIARQRAKELDVHMEKFRRDIVESSKFCFLLPTDIVMYNLWSCSGQDMELTRPLQTVLQSSSQRSSRRTPLPSSNRSSRSLPSGFV